MVGFMVIDLWWDQPLSTKTRPPGALPFSHVQHVDSLQMDCAYCHAAGLDGVGEWMPSQSTCLECHRVPVSTSKTLPAFDSALALADPYPWVAEAQIPDHVRFQHSVHRLAGLSCVDCHGTNAQIDQGRRALVSMESCVDCHTQDSVSTDCSTCHR